MTCKQQFVDRMIAIMNARKVKIFDIVENKVKEHLERLGVQKQEIEQQLKMHETTIEKKRNTFKAKHKRSNRTAR